MIDIVMIWVDGNDPEWQQSFQNYSSLSNGDKRINRFRDWDNLRYWFRGIEKFMPWVHKVHFVTCGHIPYWLNLNAPKLNFVKHSDYIPQEYLPTFNSNTIELNLHRIQGLAEKFIFFNDDMFVLQPLKKERFFKNDLPCDMNVHTPIMLCNGIGHIEYNDLEVINRNFTKKESIKNLKKYFNLCYGRKLLKNVLSLPWPQITGYENVHIANSFLKSTFQEVWEKESRLLHNTCLHKFRTNEDVNQYVYRYWQLASGQFHPINTHKDSAQISITKDNLKIINQIITKQTKSMICLHDESYTDFDSCKQEIITYFSKILPDKCSFEI